MAVVCQVKGHRQRSESAFGLVQRSAEVGRDVQLESTTVDERIECQLDDIPTLSTPG
jgi:hypothetical protein